MLSSYIEVLSDSSRNCTRARLISYPISNLCRREVVLRDKSYDAEHAPKRMEGWITVSKLLLRVVFGYRFHVPQPTCKMYKAYDELFAENDDGEP